jgi:hypothetical protein
LNIFIKSCIWRLTLDRRFPSVLNITNVLEIIASLVSSTFQHTRTIRSTSSIFRKSKRENTCSRLPTTTRGIKTFFYIGCGKTSTIKAIAAYTGRHLVEIPLSRIRTCDELKRAFYLNSYDTIDLNFSNKLIVFEDIDCSKLLNPFLFDQNK